MDQPHMLTRLEPDMLAQAFPAKVQPEALAAAEAVFRRLGREQWTDRFTVQVEGESILIPSRLHFAPVRIAERWRVAFGGSRPDVGETVRRMMLCLRTRSGDGFQRQQALRELLVEAEPWSAPFIVALIGEYVVEILRDIEAALSPKLLAALTDFILANPGYWRLTRQRVASYWNVYYRDGSPRSDYAGFKLVDRLQTSVRERGPGK
jgi:hypothetical protein